MTSQPQYLRPQLAPSVATASPSPISQTSQSASRSRDSWPPSSVPLPQTPSLPCRIIHQATLTRLTDGCTAIAIALVAQLLIAVVDHILGRTKVDFPPSILAMAAVFGVVSLSGCILGTRVETFYRNRLKRAADLLNRHMSIGFTIPFIMICKGPMSDVTTIGAIIGCFILTGLFNTILSYMLALPLQCLMSQWGTGCWKSKPADVEAQDAEKSEGQRTTKVLRAPIKSICDSLESSLTISTYPHSSGDESSCEDHALTATTPSIPAPEPDATIAPSSWMISLATFALNNPMLIICWFLVLAVGLPLRYTRKNDVVLSTCLLFALWLSTLCIQSSIKASPRLAPWPRTFLSGLFNAVLWTSLAMTSYILIDGFLSRRTLGQMLSTLSTSTTLSSLISGTASSSDFAAGDIALSILNAGLVSWGLKLYEYRAQLLSRAGLTVFSVSTLLALGNVACGPLFAASLGVSPASRALSFAARSVTLALGNPVLAVLNGDTGLNAAMVVVSGIVYQMLLGFGVGSWLERTILPAAPSKPSSAGEDDLESQQQQPLSTDNDPRTVAAGVTIGINAAAMGTAYLYETQSEAAPYSALSMMALGIMTVVFSTISPLAAWVVASVA
ncbi:hypothetical protein QBC35DRAFT_384686 [Podospora australis]|uniref:LrgB-like protein n=1 Tax=Podospora australis TaxID=1536484 RepID=A0AAN7AI70_9PEZI|nr:hypothetical protein QBC35DRAFT_384686 [Podospora australis]